MFRRFSQSKLSNETVSTKMRKRGDEAAPEFRAALVRLLALCAQDRNFYTERANQKLLSVDECVMVSAAFKDHSPILMGAYAYFADEVYLNTESTTMDTKASAVFLLQYNDKLWTLLEGMNKLMRDVARTSKDEDLIEDVYRIAFGVCVPFVTHFFAKNFNAEQAKQDELHLANQLLDSVYLLRLRAHPKLDRDMRHACTTAIRTLVNQRLTGIEYTKKIWKISTSQVSSQDSEERPLLQTPTHKTANKGKTPEMRLFLRRVRSLICRAVAKEYLMEDISTVQEDEAAKSEGELSLEVPLCPLASLLCSEFN